MSRGLGSVQRKIAEILDNNPDDAFRVDELVWEVYGDKYQPEKKQRVAVIRAAKAIVKKRSDLDWLGSSGPGNSLVFYHWASLMSYARARLKYWGCHRYRDEYSVEGRLSPGGNHYEDIQEGGEWWLIVQERIATRNGDTALAEKIKPMVDARKAKFQAMMAMLKGR